VRGENQLEIHSQNLNKEKIIMNGVSLVARLQVFLFFDK
jgi:hypothetical protein